MLNKWLNKLWNSEDHILKFYCEKYRLAEVESYNIDIGRLKQEEGESSLGYTAARLPPPKNTHTEKVLILLYEHSFRMS